MAPDIAFPESERVAFERNELFPLAKLDQSAAEKYVHVEHLVGELEGAEVPIVREYLDGNLEFARAAEELEQETLMYQGEATLKYLNEYRTYMVTYTLGHAIWKDCFEVPEARRETDQDRWNRYRGQILAGTIPKFCDSAKSAGDHRNQ